MANQIKLLFAGVLLLRPIWISSMGLGSVTQVKREANITLPGRSASRSRALVSPEQLHRARTHSTE